MNPFNIGDLVHVFHSSVLRDVIKGDVLVKDVSGDMIRVDGDADCNWWDHSNFSLIKEGVVSRSKHAMPEPHRISPVAGGQTADIDPGPWTRVKICEEIDPSGIPADVPGAKLDQGKTEAGLLLDFGLALREVSCVCTYGVGKYTRHGWLQVEDGERRYRDAGIRHQLASNLEECDKDSGILHLAHQAWNVLAELELKLRSQ